MKASITIAMFLLTVTSLFSQVEESSALYQTLREKDSLLFTVGFNTCDIRQFENLVSDSFEFYHDQAGITASKKAFISGIKNGLCKLDYKPRRQLINHSLKVYPLEKQGVIYGAVQTGEHQFYAVEKHTPEHLTSTAKFTHVWLLENGQWKLSRGLSYDHREPNAAAAIDNSKPFVLGVIDEIQSVELGEKRILNIYLPEGYKQDDTTKYPVIYLLDGSADEDFIHIAGLVQFNNFPWISRVPKSIVVGIANVDRKRDFTFPTSVEADRKQYPATGHSDKFITFIEKELQPYINKKYRTNTSKMIIGQSLGGLLATEILLKKPKLFNQYVIVSPSLWWDNGSLLQQPVTLLQDTAMQQTSVYIGVGREGLTPGATAHVMEVDANVLADKLKNVKNHHVEVYFDYLPQEDHATVTHQAVFNAFRLLYPAQGK